MAPLMTSAFFAAMAYLEGCRYAHGCSGCNLPPRFGCSSGLRACLFLPLTLLQPRVLFDVSLTCRWCTTGWQDFSGCILRDQVCGLWTCTERACCRSGKQIVSTVKAKLKPTLLANWTVWPLAHVINFALVPPAQRILYINVVNVSVPRSSCLPLLPAFRLHVCVPTPVSQ